MAHSPVDEKLSDILRRWARAATEADRCQQMYRRHRDHACALEGQLVDRIGAGKRSYATVGGETYRLSVDDDGKLTIEVI